MRQFWDQLTRSQKRTLTAGSAAVALFLLAQIAVIPYLDARAKVRQAIAASEKALRDLTVLGKEYGALRLRSEEIRKASERRPPGFVLLSYVERKATETALKPNLRSLTPLAVTPTGAYEETAVEMKLDRLTTRQLTDFLYRVESPEEMIRIRRISISKMKENSEYLSALIQVFTYQPLASRSR
jgi:hypothetical protein